MAEMSGIHEHLNIVTNDRHKCQKKLDESELIRTGLVTKLNEALAKNITSNEDLNKFEIFFFFMYIYVSAETGQ